MFVTRAGPDPGPWMVGGEGGLRGDALDRGAPARLTPCPAGGAPQEGEGQPQQHGFWLESPGLLERRGQAIPSQRGASPDLVGPSTVGRGVLPACGVLRSRLGAGSLVPGHPPLGPLYPPPGPCGPPSWRKEQRGHQGGRKELRVGVLPGANPRAIQWGGSRMCCVYCLGPAADTNTRRQ